MGYNVDMCYVDQQLSAGGPVFTKWQVQKVSRMQSFVVSFDI